MAPFRTGLGPFLALNSLLALGSCSPPGVASPYSGELLNALAAHPPPTLPPSPGAPVAPAPTPAPAAASVDAPMERNRPAELLHRAMPEAVLAGQRAAFGLDVADDEFDVVRVAVEDLPAGATFDARTLTLHWAVPRSLAGQTARFRVQLTELFDGGALRSTTVPVSVRVLAHGPLPSPAVASHAPWVNTLVTITDPAFLAPTAREFPITRALEVARDGAIDALPAERQASVERRTGAQLLDDLLTEYARLQQNPRLDPASPARDHGFDAARWRLVAVRPRVNKHVQELRLVYQATDVAEPVFAMFRFRLFRGAWPASPALVESNNRAFTGLVHAAFFDGAHARPGIAEGRAPAVSRAVQTLVRSVLTYRDASDPALRVGLVAIPLEARMGGGSVFRPDGEYLQGNAWAWGVANVRVADAPGGHSAPRVGVVPISSFTFDVGPSADGASFTSVCPPRYAGAGAEPELHALCERDGTVRMPERNAEGHTVPARRDSMSEHTDSTRNEMLARVPLSDPRRRNFEENGMTCAQCHLRNFDDGVLSELQVSDPRVSQPVTPARTIERVALQVVPVGGVRRSPWFVQEETSQVCDLGRKIAHYVGARVSLPCPEGY